MLDKEDAKLQLEAIYQLHQALMILVKFCHQLWDSPSLEQEIREFIMGLYSTLMIDALQPTHNLLRNLEMEYEVMYNGDPKQVEEESEESEDEIIFVPEWDEGGEDND